MDARLAHQHIRCSYRAKASLPFKSAIPRYMYSPVTEERVEIIFHFSKVCSPVHNHSGQIHEMKCHCTPHRAVKSDDEFVCNSFNYHVTMDGFSYKQDFLAMIRNWYSSNKKKQKLGYLKISKKHWNIMFTQKQGYVNNSHLVVDTYLRSFKLSNSLSQHSGFVERNRCNCKLHKTLLPSSMVMIKGKPKYYSYKVLEQMGYI